MTNVTLYDCFIRISAYIFRGKSLLYAKVTWSLKKYYLKIFLLLKAKSNDQIQQCIHA